MKKIRYLPDLGYCYQEPISGFWYLYRPGQEDVLIPFNELLKAYYYEAGNPLIQGIFDYPGRNARVAGNTKNLFLADSASDTFHDIEVTAHEVLIYKKLSIWNQQPGGQFIDENAGRLLSSLTWKGMRVPEDDWGGWISIDSFGINIRQLFWGPGKLTLIITNNTGADKYVGATWSAWITTDLRLET